MAHASSPSCGPSSTSGGPGGSVARSSSKRRGGIFPDCQPVGRLTLHRRRARSRRPVAAAASVPAVASTVGLFAGCPGGATSQISYRSESENERRRRSFLCVATAIRTASQPAPPAASAQPRTIASANYLLAGRPPFRLSLAWGLRVGPIAADIRRSVVQGDRDDAVPLPAGTEVVALAESALDQRLQMLMAEIRATSERPHLYRSAESDLCHRLVHDHLLSPPSSKQAQSRMRVPLRPGNPVPGDLLQGADPRLFARSARERRTTDSPPSRAAPGASSAPGRPARRCGVARSSTWGDRRSGGRRLHRQ